MSGNDPGARKADYRGARIGAASALIGVIVFILVYDAISTQYEASPIVITVVLGAAVTLLGIEAGLTWLGR